MKLTVVQQCLAVSKTQFTPHPQCTTANHSILSCREPMAATPPRPQATPPTTQTSPHPSHPLPPRRLRLLFLSPKHSRSSYDLRRLQRGPQGAAVARRCAAPQQRRGPKLRPRSSASPPSVIYVASCSGGAAHQFRPASGHLRQHPPECPWNPPPAALHGHAVRRKAATLPRRGAARLLHLPRALLQRQWPCLQPSHRSHTRRP